MPTIPNRLDLVERVRARYPTPLGGSHASFLIATAGLVEVETGLNCGLLRKPGGTVIRLPDGTTVSQDFLTFKFANGEVWGVDILADGEGEARPTWGTPEQFPPERFYDVAGGAPPDPPPPDPPPSDEIPAAVKAYVDKLVMDAEFRCQQNIVGLATTVAEEVTGVKARVTTLEEQPSGGFDPGQYRIDVSVGRNYAHNHPATATLVKK